MKLVLDEKLKHRLVGLAVIISIGAIFAPALMKKSSQHLENNFSVNVRLPAKPIAPKVVISDEQDVFKTIKIAKVTIPSVSEKEALPELAKAERIEHKSSIETKTVLAVDDTKTILTPIQTAVKQAANDHAKKMVRVAAIKTAKPAPIIAANTNVKPKLNKIVHPKAPVLARKPTVKSGVYAVQLASFAQISNAQSLVNKLRNKGYKANYMKVPGKQGQVYKVYAGYSSQREDVLKLKNQLASAMQLNGFIVNTGVS